MLHLAATHGVHDAWRDGHPQAVRQRVYPARVKGLSNFLDIQKLFPLLGQARADEAAVPDGVLRSSLKRAAKRADWRDLRFPIARLLGRDERPTK